MSRVTEIQVSGLKIFSGNEWRNAIRHFLFGIWGAKDEVVYRPKISFTDKNGRGITLHRHSSGYYSISGYLNPTGMPELKRDPTVIEAVADQFVFEGSLIRFLERDAITMFVVQFKVGNALFLWKDPNKRGFLGVSTTGDVPE